MYREIRCVAAAWVESLEGIWLLVKSKALYIEQPWELLCFNSRHEDCACYSG
ncbi:unnamed protein product [Penicillium salamii]|nr:unnamed protein product [Penicillium salamii]